MKAHHIFTAIVLAVLVSCAVSCVYPFEAELGGESGTFVIEGDILIGELSKINLSYTAPVSDPGNVSTPKTASVWVEDDRGGEYSGRDAGNGEFYVDLTEADPLLNYRLRVTNGDSGRDYASSWLRVCKAPVIDSLSYIKHEDKSILNIALSMHSEGESYFKWRYHEDWEYHAEMFARIEYFPPVKNTSTWNGGLGVIEDMPYGVNKYFCWDSNDSSEIMVFSTETQTEDRFVDLEFHAIPRDALKIQTLYHIDVTLEPITEDAYIYWNNIKTNSEYNGSLFAPNPSEMAGNIRCLNDTTEMVFGFINAAMCDTQSLFFDNTYERFYKAMRNIREEPVAVSDRKEWLSRYTAGWIPYDYEDPLNPSVTMWALKDMVDCRCQGGNKNRPPYWPNEHN